MNDIIKYLVKPNYTNNTNTLFLPRQKEVERFNKVIFLLSLPVLLFLIYSFGTNVIVTLIVGLFTLTVTDWLFSSLTRKPISGANLVFAILFTVALPVNTPWWLVALACLFGAILGREIFGGSGYQLFHPALLGRLFIVINFPQFERSSFFQLLTDGMENPSIKIIWLGYLIAAALFLVFYYRHSIYIILSSLLLALLVSIAFYSIGQPVYNSLIEFLILDGLLLGIVIFACDPTLSPKSIKGTIIFGLLVGFLAIVVQKFSSTLNEGWVLAILFANMVTPLIDSIFNSSTRISYEGK
jgi:Na+-transporting NADH:ubiquinone oxidoreductase subunit B